MDHAAAWRAVTNAVGLVPQLRARKPHRRLATTSRHFRLPSKSASDAYPASRKLNPAVLAAPPHSGTGRTSEVRVRRQSSATAPAPGSAHSIRRCSIDGANPAWKEPPSAYHAQVTGLGHLGALAQW